jgi:hypothetical protein
LDILLGFWFAKEIIVDIHNVRLGFATNSSSQHSMIFLKGAKDKHIGDGNFDFGWDYFTAASEETKSMYFAILVIRALYGICDERTAQLIAADMLGCEPSDIVEGCIDHQSEHNLPMNWKGNGLNKEFAQEFKDFLLQDDLVILGGNDNTRKTHPLAGPGAFKLALFKDAGRDSLVARKDPQGFWTIFNRQNGAKMRFSFPKKDAKPKKNEYKMGVVVPTKTYAPELIDIKITDFCPYQCSFCYQGSSPTGAHAGFTHSYNLLYALEDLGVFEVAIGGGEPTAHPKFVNILQEFRSHGIVPSFSTRNLSWLKDPTLWHPILESCGSFAYSIDKSEQSVDEFAAILTANGFRGKLSHLIPRPTIHHIITGGEDHNLRQILKSAAYHDIDVVLLGYKNVGRGLLEPKECDGNWIDTVIKLQDKDECPRISIDTTLAKASAKKLKDTGIPNWMYDIQEGSFSMYIDMVTKKMGPSSFCSNDELIDLDWSKKGWDTIKKQIVSTFASW